MDAARWILIAFVGGFVLQNVSAIRCLECIQGGVCTNKTNCVTCFARIEGVHIDRGCLGPNEPSCSSPDNCKQCSTDDCNDWLNCHSCQGCTDAEINDNKQFCEKGQKDDFCYTSVNGDKANRGCLSNLTNEDECKTDTNCKLCTGDNCNNHKIADVPNLIECLQCTSDDEKCKSGTATAVICGDEPKNKCITRVENQKLERGCLLKLTQAEQSKCTNASDSTCVACDTNGCNNNTWLQCHQCEEGLQATCGQAQNTPSNAKFCPKYKTDDKCFERLVNSKVVRGCESELGEDACKGNTQCKVCTGDACNSDAAATLANTHNCLQCKSSQDPSDSCLLGTASSQACTDANDNKCYSKVDQDGILHRGCKSDMPPADVPTCNNTKCKLCDSKGCNNETFPTDRLRCYQCKTNDSNATCADALTGEGNALYCPVYQADDKCFARIKEGVFERGCQSSLGKDEEACKGLNEKECFNCTGENCNGLSETKLKNSAGRLTSGALILTVLHFVVAKQLFR